MYATGQAIGCGPFSQPSPHGSESSLRLLAGSCRTLGILKRSSECARAPRASSCRKSERLKNQHGSVICSPVYNQKPRDPFFPSTIKIL